MSYSPYTPRVTSLHGPIYENTYAKTYRTDAPQTTTPTGQLKPHKQYTYLDNAQPSGNATLKLPLNSILQSSTSRRQPSPPHTAFRMPCEAIGKWLPFTPSQDLNQRTHNMPAPLPRPPRKTFSTPFNNNMRTLRTLQWFTPSTPLRNSRPHGARTATLNSPATNAIDTSLSGKTAFKDCSLKLFEHLTRPSSWQPLKSLLDNYQASGQQNTPTHMPCTTTVSSTTFTRHM